MVGILKGIMYLILASVIINFLGTEEYKFDKPNNSAPFIVVESSMKKNMLDYPEIKLTLRNNTGHDIKSTTLKIDYYTKNGSKLGEKTLHHKNIASNQMFSFSTLLLEKDATKFKLVSIKYD